MRKPRGIRNNNPLNIRCSDNAWVGVSGKDKDGFCQFTKPEYGIRAAARILQSYWERHGIDTLRGVITRWAPTDDGNPVDAYVTAVSIWADIDPDDTINLFDYQIAYRLLMAMARFENGKPPADRDPSWYAPETWEKGLRMAGLVPGKPLRKSRTANGAVVAGGGVTGAIGVLTGTFGIPPEIANLLPNFIASLDKDQVSVVLGMIALAGSLFSLYARHDDKRQGRL